ncbi:MAG TPA: Dabb family protein [Puia sp.]|nr:Dabb family protein [Puia sp.]
MAEEIKNIFIHHVYFWLAEPGNAGHKKLLIEGLKKLSSVTTIQRFHIGQPANTSRTVIDSSYSVSWILIFKNATDQDSYQVDPIHLRFVEECKHLWNRVVVYDSVDASNA